MVQTEREREREREGERERKTQTQRHADTETAARPHASYFGSRQSARRRMLVNDGTAKELHCKA